MAKQHEIKITPGTPKFNKMIFRLIPPVTAKRLQTMDYGGNQLQMIQKGVFAMPILVTAKFNLFMVVAKLVGHDWVAAFSEATIEHHNEITDLSTPMPTGKGLNLLGQHDAKSANRLLKYFQTLIDTKHGEWRLIK